VCSTGAHRRATKTNRNMVRDTGKTAEAKALGPKPRPTDVGTAPESDRQSWTTRHPLDSPQPKPVIGQDRTKGLPWPVRRGPRRPSL
jgi:hypothetical protein